MSSPARSRRRRRLRELLVCPDCRSESLVIGASYAQVRHDPTCPQFNATGGGQPYREHATVDIGGVA